MATATASTTTTTTVHNFVRTRKWENDIISILESNKLIQTYKRKINKDKNPVDQPVISNMHLSYNFSSARERGYERAENVSSV